MDNICVTEESQRGGQVIHVWDEKWTKSNGKEASDIWYYRCSQKGCSGTLKRVRSTNECVRMRAHTLVHASTSRKFVKSVAASEVRKIIEDLTVREKNRDIFEAAQERTLSKISSIFGVESSIELTQTYNRKRNHIGMLKRAKFGTEPSSHEDLELTEFDKNIILVKNPLKIEPFFVKDINEDNTRILIWAIPELFSKMCEQSRIYGDGTFTKCPKQFAQMYTLQFQWLSNRMYCGVFALMTNRTIGSYEKLLIALEEYAASLGTRFNPSSVTVDFEKAAIRAFENRYSGVTLRCCHFHLGRNFLKKFMEVGLAKTLRYPSRERQAFRQILALSLLPIEDVTDAFYLVVDRSPHTQAMNQFLNYVEKNYILTNATFPINIWNHSDHSGPRTTNGVEGFHNRHRTKFSDGKPKFCSWIEVAKVCTKEDYFSLKSEEAVPEERQRQSNHQAIRILSQRDNYNSFMSGPRDCHAILAFLNNSGTEISVDALMLGLDDQFIENSDFSEDSEHQNNTTEAGDQAEYQEDCLASAFYD